MPAAGTFAAVLLALLVLVPGWWSTQVRALNSATSFVIATSQDQSLATPGLGRPAEAKSTEPPPVGIGTENAGAVADASGVRAGSPPAHITYSSVGMDQPVLPLTPTNQELQQGSIVPPLTGDAYWLSSYGTPGAESTNTTYIVGHSWEGRPSPFNNISSQAKPGDQFTVTTKDGPLAYVIDTVTTEDKDTLRDSPIWHKEPHRLIIITCYTADIWETNIIIQASPLPAS